jgi:DNA-binding transcriptional LysR family regulator
MRNWRSGLVLVVPGDDPLGRRTSVRLDDAVLLDRDFVEYRADSALRAWIDAACAAAGLAWRIVCEVANMQYLVESVQQGLGIAVLPPTAIRAADGHVGRGPDHTAAAPRSERGHGGGPAAHGAVAALPGLLAAGLPGDAG